MDALEFKTAKHSAQYDRIGNLLSGTEIGSEGRKELYFYVPKDDCAMYSVTDWLADWEIPEINKIRKQYNKAEIFRLARTNTGYVRVLTISERKRIEKDTFKEEVYFDVLNANTAIHANKF